MILNLWATYCGPCVEELPYFEAFYREHRDDAAMLAVHASVVTDDPAAFMADRGWTIPAAIDKDERVWETVNGSSTLPQTVVLDRRGAVVYNRKGSVTPEMLEALYALAAESFPNVPIIVSPAVFKPEAGEECRVLVTDEDGSPIPGVTVQFCSDTECVTGTTGADGKAVFHAEEGLRYTVHILKVPAGYAGTDEEFETADSSREVHIRLRKSA